MIGQMKISSSAGKNPGSRAKADDAKSEGRSEGRYGEMNRPSKMDAAQKAAATAAYIAGSKGRTWIPSKGLQSATQGIGQGGDGAPRVSSAGGPCAQPNVSHEDKVQGMKDTVDAKHDKMHADFSQAKRAQIAKATAAEGAELSGSETAQSNKAVANKSGPPASTQSHAAQLSLQLNLLASSRGQSATPTQDLV